MLGGELVRYFLEAFTDLQENSELHITSESKFHMYSQGNKKQWKLTLRDFLWFFHVMPFSHIGYVLCFLLDISIQLFFSCHIGEQNSNGLWPAQTFVVQQTSLGSEVLYFFFFFPPSIIGMLVLQDTNGSIEGSIILLHSRAMLKFLACSQFWKNWFLADILA